MSPPRRPSLNNGFWQLNIPATNTAQFYRLRRWNYMSTKTITVVATFEAKPGKEAELRKLLLGLIEPTRKEAGCLNYDLHICRDNPAKFLFHENWASKELLDAHLASKHLTAALPKVPELCASSPEIKFLEKIG